MHDLKRKFTALSIFAILFAGSFTFAIPPALVFAQEEILLDENLLDLIEGQTLEDSLDEPTLELNENQNLVDSVPKKRSLCRFCDKPKVGQDRYGDSPRQKFLTLKAITKVTSAYAGCRSLSMCGGPLG